MQPAYTTKEYWDTRAKKYKGNPVLCLFNDPRFKEFEQQVDSFLRDKIKLGDKVLDVACGYARFANTVHLAGGIWRGIDFSEEMRKQSPPSIQHRFYVGDAKMPHIDGKISRMQFDLIYCVNSLHVLQMNPKQYCDLYYPFCKPGGIIASLECDVFTLFPIYKGKQ